MNNNLKELIKIVKEKDSNAYESLMANLEFLKTERLKIVGNSLRNTLGRSKKDMDKDKIMSIMENIRDLSKKHDVEFNIPSSWEGIEKLLRISILEDVQEEFERQK